MVGSIFRKLLTEIGIRTNDAECNLMEVMCNFANLVLILKVVWQVPSQDKQSTHRLSR